VTDLQTALPGHLSDRLGPVVDREAKIPRALGALGPVADRDVVVVGGAHVGIAPRLAESGARVTAISADDLTEPDISADAEPADVLVVAWSAFRGPTALELAAARRLLRPGGRLLVVHDYGRDDVSRLVEPRPEYRDWSRRDGPFLGDGFKVHVVHCWWTFDSLEEARAFLTEAFGVAGEQVSAQLTRPRLSYNVAIYHRTLDAA